MDGSRSPEKKLSMGSKEIKNGRRRTKDSLGPRSGSIPGNNSGSMPINKSNKSVQSFEEVEVASIEIEFEGEEYEESPLETIEEEEEEMIEEEEPPVTPIKRSTLEEKLCQIGTFTKAELDDLSPIFQLRRYYSEVSLPKTLAERIPEAKPGPLLKERCLSMEDLILSSEGYEDLVTGSLDHIDHRQYEISAKKMAEWRGLHELEKNRFSFFDELFAMGCVVDRLEVPSKVDNLDFMVEADPSALRAKVDYGRIVLKTKNMYLGNFMNWYFEGPGRYRWTNGTTYQGDFSNGVMHGEGILLWTDGSTYEGQFKNGIRAGWGVYSTADGYTYAGDWFHGLPHGKGKMWYDPENDNGDFYDGEWANGKPNGIGTRQYRAGDRYVGSWEAGNRSGFGTMTWLTERQVYKGEWKQGVPHGSGRHTWYLARTNTSNFPTRHVYEGEWENGLRHGIGRMVYPCGSIYEGRYQDGQRHGRGIFINPAGEMLVGLFRVGSIMGGLGVPLHTPSYQCDFGSLVSNLNAKFGINSTEEIAPTEETRLSEMTSRFLSQIRKLYKRAGVLGNCWGNPGLYPHWMDKSQSKPRGKGIGHNKESDQTQRTLFGMQVEGTLHKKKSPDNINPVTRFGLWLLLRDCPGILKDMTTAEFDRIFNSFPSISFQTSHNPFEPVYLWQFLQCLVVIAAVIYIDVPRKKHLLRPRPHKKKKSLANNILEQIPTGDQQPEENEDEMEENMEPIEPSEPQNLSIPAIADPAPLEEIEADEDEEEDEEEIETGNVVEAKESEIEKRNDSDSSEGDEVYSAWQLSDPDYTAPGISQAFENLLLEKLIHCLHAKPGLNLPPTPIPLPSLADLYQSFTSTTGGQNLVSGIEFIRSVLPHELYPKKEDAIFWTRSKEILSPLIDMEYITEFYKIPSREAEEGELLGPDFLGEKISNTSIFTEKLKEEASLVMDGRIRASITIYGSGNTVFGINPTEAEAKAPSPKSPASPEILPNNSDEPAELEKAADAEETEPPDIDLMESTLFADRDLVPEPFLWTQESKCASIPRKEISFANIKTRDVLNVLRCLYPRVRGKPLETDLQFDMTFCDWVFATSMVAKVSSDREVNHAMTKESIIEHKHLTNRLNSAKVGGKPKARLLDEEKKIRRSKRCQRKRIYIDESQKPNSPKKTVAVVAKQNQEALVTNNPKL